MLAIHLARDESWKKSVPAIIEYTKAFGSTLHVVTVIPDFDMSIVVAYFLKYHEEKALAECKEKRHVFTKGHIPDGIKVQQIIACGTAYEEILNLSKKIKCDLIVLGHNRPKAQNFFLDSHSVRIVRHADCSVLVIRELIAFLAGNDQRVDRQRTLTRGQNEEGIDINAVDSIPVFMCHDR